MDVRPFVIIFVSVAGLTPRAFADTFQGTCDGLKDYIKNTGVHDDKGMPHQTKAGWTNFEFPAGVNYTDHSTKYLGKKICFSATAHLTYEIKPITSVITWVPTGCDPCMCKFLAEDWQQRLANHEGFHISAAQAIVDKLNRETKPFRVSACGPRAQATEQSVKPEFNRQALARAARKAARARKGFDENEDLFDQSAVGQVPLDCATCPPCAPNEQPSCKACPPASGQILYNGQCLTLCGDWVPGFPGVYRNCGLSSAAQPVFCCTIHTPAGEFGVCHPNNNIGACP